MSQHDFDIANQGFAAFRADLNNALKALGSLSSGTAEPATTYANQLWYETDTNTLHIRNEANSAWLDLMVIDQTTGSPSFTAGNVGIGTASPGAKLDVIGTSGSTVAELQVGANDDVALNFRNAAGTQVGYITSHVDSITIDGDFTKFSTGGTERMKIDSSGNVLFGKVTSDANLTGVEARPDGLLIATRDLPTAGSDSVFLIDRRTSTGDVMRFRKDGATIGYIGVGASNPYIGSGDVTLVFTASGDAIVPAGMDGATRSGAIDLGNSANRWDTIFATVGTINTSDRTEKQDIEELNDAERRVAVACKGLLRKYRLKSAVALKGEDARIHFGIIAQDLQAAFEAEGLDAGRYGMFINSTWTDEETGEEKSLMGVRYSELLAFMISVL